MTTGCGAGNACTYDVRYYSIDDVGNTEATVTSANQARVDREAPTAPTGFTATDAQAGAGDQCDMSWNNDASDGSGSGLHTTGAFKVRYLQGASAPADCSSGTLGCTVGSGSTSCNITGLTTSQQYTFRLCVEDNVNNQTSDGTATCTPTGSWIAAGPVDPTTGVSDSSGACGSRAWSNIPNAFAQDDTNADSNNVQSETTACLKLTNFDFSSIPAGSTIVGIKAEADRYMEATAGTITDGIVRLVRAGTISFVGDNKASGTTWATSDTDTYESYGGASDQWGEAWNLERRDQDQCIYGSRTTNRILQSSGMLRP
jgi:hypothetical protein